MRPQLKRPLDARRSDRIQFVMAEVRLRQQGATAITVIIKDLSRTGFRVEWPHTVTIGQVFWITLPGLAPMIAQAIWSQNFEVGCRFEGSIHPAVFRSLVREFPK